MSHSDLDPAATPPSAAPELQRDVERGLQFTNVMLSVTQDQAIESATHVQALANRADGE